MILAVLDYSLGEVNIKSVPKQLQDLDGDDILSEMGFNSSTTEYLIVDEDLPINITTPGLVSTITVK